MVVGGNKPQTIELHPVLAWYSKLFDASVRQSGTSLMVIGYGFRDRHINEVIERAVRECGLKFFNIGPHGSDQAWAMNPTRQPGHIQNTSELERTFEQGLIGASRRPLAETFGGNLLEHRKVMRFYED